MIGKITGGKIELDLENAGIDEILSEEVKPFGSNGGHITIKGKHVGKKARVIIYSAEKKEANKS